MKPIEFKHQNKVFAKDQPEYQQLPALKIDSPNGEVISCWKLSFKERAKILFTGRVWLSLMSFNKPLTPSFLSVNRKDIYSHPDDEKTTLKQIKEFISGLKNKIKNTLKKNIVSHKRKTIKIRYVIKAKSGNDYVYRIEHKTPLGWLELGERLTVGGWPIWDPFENKQQELLLEMALRLYFKANRDELNIITYPTIFY